MTPVLDPAAFNTRWVHVFEEDTRSGAVFRPEESDIPLSRRPRMQLTLKADGSAELLTGGPDDRLVPEPAQWRAEDDAVVVCDASGAVRLRIIEHSAGRLVAQIGARA